MIHNKILSAKHYYDNQIQRIKEKLAILPDGLFYCVHDKNRIKWYYSHDHKEHYISKKNRVLAEQLALRRFLSLLLKDYEHERLALEFYQKHHLGTMGHAAQEFFSKPEYQELISPYFKPLSQELFDWSKETYESNPYYPEQLNIKASSGNMVRSKSEAMIDMVLTLNQIPFRYEAPLILDGIIFYPDFTIRHPQTGELYYWEHFGLIDKPKYRQNCFSKLDHYLGNNILPGKNLIITFETSKQPLCMDTIQKIVEDLFL